MIWNDENTSKPTKDGNYLCMVRWYLESGYDPSIIYFRNGEFIISESAEHIYWTEIPDFAEKSKQ